VHGIAGIRFLNFREFSRDAIDRSICEFFWGRRPATHENLDQAFPDPFIFGSGFFAIRVQPAHQPIELFSIEVVGLGPMGRATQDPQSPGLVTTGQFQSGAIILTRSGKAQRRSAIF
jgi:hypothetical protein